MVARTNSIRRCRDCRYSLCSNRNQGSKGRAMKVFIVIICIVLFIAVIIWAAQKDDERCIEHFGQGWHSASYNRYGPSCINDKGEGKWL